MIKTFADRQTHTLFITGESRHIPPDLTRRAIRKPEYIDLANAIDDLKVPPSNRLHALKGARKGFFSIAVNDQWRICFRFVEGNAYDVQLLDYH